jgi:hypothetical protein
VLVSDFFFGGKVSPFWGKKKKKLKKEYAVANSLL